MMVYSILYIFIKQTEYNVHAADTKLYKNFRKAFRKHTHKLNTTIYYGQSMFTFGVYEALPWVEFRGRQLFLHFTDVLRMNIIKQALSN